MRYIVLAMLLMFGISVSGSVLACEGSKSHKAKTGTSAPATPAPAPTK